MGTSGLFVEAGDRRDCSTRRVAQGIQLAGTSSVPAKHSISARLRHSAASFEQVGPLRATAPGALQGRDLPPARHARITDAP
jgi:hypothetical protein